MKRYACREKKVACGCWDCTPDGYEYFTIEAQNWKDAQEKCDAQNSILICEI